MQPTAGEAEVRPPTTHRHSEPHAGCPQVARSRMQEVEVRAEIPVGRPSSRRGWILELFASPKHRRFRSRAPEFGNLGERTSQPTLHSLFQKWGTSCQNLEVLPLERDGEKPDRAP